MEHEYIVAKIQTGLDKALQKGHTPVRVWLAPVDLARLADLERSVHGTVRLAHPQREFCGVKVSEDVLIQRSRVVCACGAAVAL